MTVRHNDSSYFDGGFVRRTQLQGVTHRSVLKIFRDIEDFIEDRTRHVFKRERELLNSEIYIFPRKKRSKAFHPPLVVISSKKLKDGPICNTLYTKSSFEANACFKKRFPPHTALPAKLNFFIH